MNDEKEVYFDKYCASCAHNSLKDYESPCNECLSNPTNDNSHKPVNYEGRKK